MASKSDTGLTTLTYQILISLADANRHGYGIIKEIEERAGEGGAPTTGALYLALQRMEAAGLVKADVEAPEDADARRRYYAITPDGREAARLESLRLGAMVAQARAKKLVG